jgi:hypothetical protein
VIVPSPDAEGVAVITEPLKAVPEIATLLKVGASYK